MSSCDWSDATGERRLGVLGASSMVGKSLLPLVASPFCQVTAYSRTARLGDRVSSGRNIDWRQLSEDAAQKQIAISRSIDSWCCLAPIWVLPDYFSMLEAHRPRRIVALSSTSARIKVRSSDAGERALAQRLLDGEQRLIVWAEERGIEWVILRPTMIYGYGRDRNIAQIARIIRRTGMFPVFGRADGLRQPVHVDDVARACLSALILPAAANETYEIGGKEPLPYRQMIEAVFKAMGRRPRLLPVPLWAFRSAIGVLRLVPRFANWSPQMASRMKDDLSVDNVRASRDLAYAPRPFNPSLRDVSGLE